MTADMEALERRVIPLKPTKETAERLKWALALAAKGFKILELQPGKKEPREKWAWSTWATTDPDKIRAMFEANPAMNYGVNPGRDYGIIDLDKKMDCDGTVAFGALEIEHGVLPETFKVRTRNGGTHLYLRVSEEIGNANKGFGRGSGIDVRGSGGYVVGPACHVTSSGWGDGRYTHV
ncbi:MAG: bifunctional DNA primase/polymerase, partial [Alphaproteobacteria bacterium]|nr:bifunctional DNA primase/polymerase [Alphaproteobacteria bacterium]